MIPILCISKSDMPEMLWTLGRESNTYSSVLFAILFFSLMIYFVVKAMDKDNDKFRLLFCLSFAIAFFVFGFCNIKKQYNHNKKYQFTNFTYNQPAKFILQYYTVTTGKQYKFIAETEHNVFIKEEK